MKYIYPAIFKPDDEGYSVYFPDLPGCFTCGDSLEEAIFMAEDVLPLYLLEAERSGDVIPKASDIKTIKTDASDFVSFVSADTKVYEKKYSNKAVKKTLTIPQWMNEAAEEKGINFSQLLQKAIREELNIIQ